MPETDDENIWAAYAKGVKPLGNAKKPEAIIRAPKKQAPPRAGKNELPLKQKPVALIQKPAAISFNRRTERRLRQGVIEIEARLDLHGMRQVEAHHALHDFITRQIKAGRRSLLIITGKGRNGPGVLRANLADWLAASPQARHILALRPAAASHGGAGAFYVILKRAKDRA